MKIKKTGWRATLFGDCSLKELNHRHTTVDVDGLSGDVLSFITGQEGYNVSDILRFTEFAGRNACH